ncbi:MAG: cytochrome c family protein [Vicinamibacteraceae bacterium]|nr:cytochrome c family protein [Vicinamibacteraceae bacterium]
MSQTFRPHANALARFTLVGALLLVVFLGWLLITLQRSDFVTGANTNIEQPIQFSHAHHVGGLGIDCRYCHTSVDQAAFANIPPTKTCMNCHTQIWATSPFLEPVRASFRTGESLQWVRVHNLPDFVYFNHSIHVAKGVGCETCHGRIDEMPGIYQTQTLQMEWCLECHRAPERFVRPRDAVTAMGYVPPVAQAELGPQLVRDYNIASAQQLTSCSTCHR